MWKLKNNPLHCRFALVWLAASVACAGCGSKTPHSDKPWSNVKVTVTAGSQPLEVGQVTLLATEGSTGVDAGGVLDASGRATFPALPGSYVAVIQPLPPPPGGGGDRHRCSRRRDRRAINPEALPLAGDEPVRRGNPPG
jgi:hypothetical protein